MNDQNYVEFKKKRDLGMIISDTIKFLSNEWKPFFLSVIKISIIPIIIAIAALIYYTMSTSTFFSSFTDINYYGDSPDLNFSGLLLPLLLFFICYIFAYSLVTVSALGYIKSYIKNKGVVNFEEVNIDTKEKFWSYVGLFFLNGLIVGFGALFCGIPGVYFWVVLSLSYCILIFQNKGATQSINDAFNFIKGHWWETFGVLLVVYLIIWTVSFVISLPASMYQMSQVGFGLQNQNPAELVEIYTDPIYIILLVFSYIVGYILYMAILVSTSLVYWDIKEQNDPSVDVIDEIGSHMS